MLTEITNRTKIVATIRPGSSSRSMIMQIAQLGMYVLYSID